MIVEEPLGALIVVESAANAVAGTDPTDMMTAIRNASILLALFGLFAMFDLLSFCIKRGNPHLGRFPNLYINHQKVVVGNKTSFYLLTISSATSSAKTRKVKFA